MVTFIGTKGWARVERYANVPGTGAVQKLNSRARARPSRSPAPPTARIAPPTGAGRRPSPIPRAPPAGGGGAPPPARAGTTPPPRFEGVEPVNGPRDPAPVAPRREQRDAP